MPTDPGFSLDTCIFMEAIPNDGGVHDGNAVWWISPDVSLRGPISGGDQADPGQVNELRVAIRRKPDTSGCTFTGAESLTVEAWVAMPSLAMIPDNKNSTHRVGFLGSALPAPGQKTSQSFEWTPRVNLPVTDPEGGGQRCVVARAYPDNLTPSSTQFFAPDDQHVVQHNLCVVPCAPTLNTCSLEIATVNPQPRLSFLNIKIKASFDANPTGHVRSMIQSRLKTIVGFVGFSPIPPTSFSLDFTGVHFPGSLIPPVTPVNTSTSSAVSIPLAGEVIKFKLGARLATNSIGRAHVIHLTQTSHDDKPQGGLTAVFIKV